MYHKDVYRKDSTASASVKEVLKNLIPHQFLHHTTNVLLRLLFVFLQDNQIAFVYLVHW